MSTERARGVRFVVVAARRRASCGRAAHETASAVADATNATIKRDAELRTKKVSEFCPASLCFWPFVARTAAAPEPPRDSLEHGRRQDVVKDERAGRVGAAVLVPAAAVQVLRQGHQA